MYDDLGGRNPYKVARSLRCAASPCPKCGRDSPLSAEVVSGDVSAYVTCPGCGRSDLEVGCDDSGDVVLEYGDQPYYRTAAERDAAGSEDPDVLAEGQRKAYRGLRQNAAFDMIEKAAEISKNPELALEASDMLSEQDMPMKASEFLSGYRDLVPDDIAKKVDFECRLAIHRSEQGQQMDALKTLKALNESSRSAPSPVRASLQEAMGTVSAFGGDRRGAAKYFREAMRLSEKDLDSEQSLDMYCRQASEFSQANPDPDGRKKSTEAMKNAVKAAEARKDRFPKIYARALLERARYMNSIDAVDPRSREYMDTAISILEGLGEDGGHDPLLPLAYYYRSASSGQRDRLDVPDLDRAYALLMEDLLAGDLPDSVMYGVCETYVQYLDLFDRERSATVRGELLQQGFVFPPPPEVEVD